MTDHVILNIPDLHAPYTHPDAVDFLDAINNKYKPDEVVIGGDELDNHYMSMHETDPNLLGGHSELMAAQMVLQPIFDMFPDVTVLESNHGSLAYRKAMKHGIPEFILKGYREITGAPDGWNWKVDHIIETPLGKLYYHHGKSAVPGKLSQSMGMSTVQFHFHTNFYIHYWASPIGLFFDMNSGSLIDHKSRAFAYAKNNLKKPMLGASLIINGVPRLIPMVLDINGKWNKRID